MKFTAILLLAASIHLSARTTAQTISLSEKNTSLTKVMSLIEQQSGYQFFYDQKLVEKLPAVSVNYKAEALEKVLSDLFKDLPISYSIVRKNIVLKAKSPEKKEVANQPIPSGVGLLENPPPPPTHDISGKITNEAGEPLAGASIKIKGSSQGAQTNNEGVFVLKGVDEKATIEISYVGYETMLLSVGSRSSFIVSLKIIEASLQEVVVNKGYYTEKKRYSVGNVATVRSTEIEKQPVQNPILALQGRVPGVEITQLTGMNGGGITVRIQGQNSINAGLDPLYVVDGVPYSSYIYFGSSTEGIMQNGSPLNYINPLDIEAIDVLKDADATAIYGSRAANGAILITTKKGKAGKSKVNISVDNGWSRVASRAKMMNRRQYLDMRYEALKNDGLTASSNPSASGTNIYAPDLTIWDTTRSTDWQKELIGKAAQTTTANIGLSGGNAAVQYYLGATYNRRTTVFPGDFSDRAGTVHANLNTTSPNQRLKTSLSFSYNYDQNHLPQVDLTPFAVNLEPVAPALYNNDGTLNWMPNASGSSTWKNPVSQDYGSDYFGTSKTLVSNATLDYKILNGLNFFTSLGYNSMDGYSYLPFRLEANAPETRATSTRTAQYAFRNTNNWIVEPQLRYSGKLAKGDIEALVGGTVQSTSSSFVQLFSGDFANDQLMSSPSAAVTKLILNSTSFIYKYDAIFGRLNYKYQNKYLLNMTARRDGSSRFGDNAKFHTFYSVGAGWIFSDEKWMKESLPFLSFGKLRASYGTTGNDQIADYLYTSTYAVSTPTIPYQSATNLNVTRIPNPYIQWEETQKFQAGIDLNFLKDRIALGVTYAMNQSSNQLINYVLPALTGFTTIQENFPALIRNTSWEFTLNTINVKNKNFTWTTSANLTIPKNKLVSFPGIELTSYASGTSNVIVGEPIGVQKLFKYAYVDPATGNWFVLLSCIFPWYPLQKNCKWFWYRFADGLSGGFALVPKQRFDELFAMIT